MLSLEQQDLLIKSWEEKLKVLMSLNLSQQQQERSPKKNEAFEKLSVAQTRAKLLKQLDGIVITAKETNKGEGKLFGSINVRDIENAINKQERLQE